MSFRKLITTCFQHPSPLLPPLSTFLHKSSFYHYCTTTTSNNTVHNNSISEEFCTWVISFCNSKFLKDGVCIHNPIIKLGFENHLVLNNNLMSFYSKCFSVEEARKVFEDMSHRDVVSWTGIISAFVKDGNYLDVVVPNEFSFSSVLRCCSSLLAFELGSSAHGQIMKHGFETNPVLASALIDFYSKCGCFDESFDIFEAINSGDTISS